MNEVRGGLSALYILLAMILGLVFWIMVIAITEFWKANTVSLKLISLSSKTTASKQFFLMSIWKYNFGDYCVFYTLGEVTTLKYLGFHPYMGLGVTPIFKGGRLIFGLPVHRGNVR